MPDQTKIHRIKLLVEVEFDYHDIAGAIGGRTGLATDKELIAETKKDFKKEGVKQFLRGCHNNLKGKIKTVAINEVK